MTAPSRRWALAGTALFLAPPAHAAPTIDVLIRDAGERDQDGAIWVDLRLLNESNEPQLFALRDAAKPGSSMRAKRKPCGLIARLICPTP